MFKQRGSQLLGNACDLWKTGVGLAWEMLEKTSGGFENVAVEIPIGPES